MTARTSVRRQLAEAIDRLGVKAMVERWKRRRGELRLGHRTAMSVGAQAGARPGAILVAPIPDARTRRLLEHAAGRRIDVAGTDAEDPRITLLIDPLEHGALPERFATVIVDSGLSTAAAAAAGRAPADAVVHVSGIRSRGARS